MAQKVRLSRRRYRQRCTLALALDVVGERWTMLVLRELFAGPKRFSDLLAGLPGVGTAILTERLHQLECHGLIGHRQLGPPTPAALYELTARGAALDPVLTGLARWGAAYLEQPGQLASRPRWLLQALAATAVVPPDQAPIVANFILDDEGCHVLVGRERVVARDGLRPDARVTVRGTARDLRALAASRSTRPGALRQRFTLEGDRRSGEHLLDQLALGARRASAAATS